MVEVRTGEGWLCVRGGQNGVRSVIHRFDLLLVVGTKIKCPFEGPPRYQEGVGEPTWSRNVLGKGTRHGE